MLRAPQHKPIGEKVFQVLADHPELVEGGLQLLIDAMTGDLVFSKSPEILFSYGKTISAAIEFPPQAARSST